MEVGRPAAGSSRTGAHRASTTAHPWRLDPFSLPARFATADEAADEGMCTVDLHRERVVLRRALSGMRMAVNLPVAAYRGVAIRLDATTETPPFVAVTLEHADAALSLPLFASTDTDDIVAEWQIWGRVLGLPLLIGDVTARLRQACDQAAADRVARHCEDNRDNRCRLSYDGDGASDCNNDIDIETDKLGCDLGVALRATL